MLSAVALALIYAPVQNPIMDLVHAEKSFSKRFSEIGFKESFLEFFAPESVSFTPEPGNAPERLKALPKDEDDGNTLFWDPAFAGINSSGDMGFTTGPLRAQKKSDGSVIPNTHGIYFSVWAKKPEGWKVLVDLGVGSPEYKGELKLLPAEKVEPMKVEPKEIVAMDKKLMKLNVPHGQALADIAEKEAVAVLFGVGPMFGADKIRSDFKNETVKWEPMEAMVSGAGDFALTYGAFGFGGEKPREGYYVRVWRRGKAGWKVVGQTMMPVRKAP